MFAPEDVFATLTNSGLKIFAGVLIGSGYLQANWTEMFIGIGIGLGAAVWSGCERGRASVSFDLLRIKVIEEEAQARRLPATALAALARLKDYFAPIR